VSQRRRPAPARRRRTDRPALSQAVARHCGALRRAPGRGPCASSRRQSRSRNWSSTIVLPRLSSCQLWAAPLPMTSSTSFMSSPARLAEGDGFRQALHQPGDADLVDHLGQLAGPAVAHPRDGAWRRPSPPASWRRTAAASPPHITVSSAVDGTRPARPIPARRRSARSLSAAASACQLSRHRGRRRGVVDEDSARLHARQRRRGRPAPPSAGRRRCRRRQNTKSAPAAASAGVGAWRAAVFGVPRPRPWPRCGCRR
jgi:hypothetical protein